MRKGVYKFYVRNFAHRGGTTGFSAEIEFNGQIYSFCYNKELKQNESINVAEVTFDGINFAIKEKIPSSLASKNIWNLETNQFYPVSIITYSPNYWDSQKGIGNRHYFLMLKNCKNSESPSGFFNEYLKEDLLKHKRVFEALGSKMRVEDTENQLSGLGFSDTQRNKVTVRVEGHTNRVLNILI